MSVENVVAAGASLPQGARAERAPRPFDRLTVGETLRLRVLERLGARDYIVGFGGERHRVESMIELEVGADVRVGVAEVGDRLVLRHLAARDEERAGENDLLGQLARRYGVTLPAPDREPLLAVAAHAADPARMLMSGLYLAKLGAVLEKEAIAAVYEAQIDERVPTEAEVQPPESAADALELADLLEHLETAFEPGDSNADSGGRGAHGESSGHELARWALNLQDEGSVLYRYATLPLVVGGSLRELQIALFTPRDAARRDGDVRRVVMTLETPQLHEVRIETKSVGDRLAVAIDVAVPEAIEAFAEREAEVRDLLARLGWSVEAVNYGVNVTPDRAAQRIVDHVLTAGTVDAVL